MTVCGWGTGGQHCDSQLHLKQTESPKKGFSLSYSVVVQLPLAPLTSSSLYTHKHTQMQKLLIQ